jgi:hypothetical protein
VYWYADGESPRCSNGDHNHQQFQVHRHRTHVTLADGTAVSAVSFDAGDPYGRDERPDYGLYLDERWQPPWPHDHVDWPDLGVPVDAGSLMRALRLVHEGARAGDHVEIGCLGGHGRTGTALACLAILSGCPPVDVIAWVRSAYCSQAIETPEQEAFVMDFATRAE